MPALTVGIPVHNGMPFLPQAIDSLRQQTYQHFEVLVIDDGSTDETPRYLQTLRDPRIRVLSQPNRGLTATLNRMLSEVRTPWLVRLDADDICLPDRLKLVRRAIDRFPDAAAFYSHARYYQDGRSFGTFRTTTASPAGLRELTRAGYLLAICHSSVTLNVSKTVAVGGYRFDLHVEDIDLWWRLALNFDIHLIPEVTVGFRLSNDSVSTRNLEQQTVNSLYVQYLLLSHLRSLPCRSYQQISRYLATLVDRRKLALRAHVRASNVSLARGETAQALRHLAAAFVCAPAHFVARAAYELRRARPAANGIPPEVFLRHAASLWPDAFPVTTGN